MSEPILVDSKSLIIVPGQKLSVPIRIYFDSPTKVRGIYAEFHGAERTDADFTETTTDSEGKTTTRTRTETEFVDHVREKQLLFGQKRLGFFGRLSDSFSTLFGGGQHEIIEGKQEFRFEMMLPKSLPPSFKGRKCSVFYQLKILVDIPVKFDWTKTADFQVLPEPTKLEGKPARAVVPDESGRSVWDQMFGKDVTLELAIDRDQARFGETISGMLVAHTLEPLNADGILLELIGTEKVQAGSHADAHIYQIPLGEIETPASLIDASKFDLQFKLPEHAGPDSTTGKNYSIEWNLRVRVKFPWAKDAYIQVPVRLFSNAKS